MHTLDGVTRGDQYRALGLSTFAFTVCFAVWRRFSVIGVKIKQDLGLNDTQLGLLVATPVLTGSVSRIFRGVWSEQFRGRLIIPVAGGDHGGLRVAADQRADLCETFLLTQRSPTSRYPSG